MHIQTSASIFGAVLIGIFILVFGCSEEISTVSNEEARLIRYSHSDTCVGSAGNDTAQVEIIVEGLQITVIHKNAIFNCCPDSIIVEFSQENDLLKLEESAVVSDPCRCFCPFEVTATIEVPCPGTYIIEIWTGNSIIWKGQVEVEGS